MFAVRYLDSTTAEAIITLIIAQISLGKHQFICSQYAKLIEKNSI